MKALNAALWDESIAVWETTAGIIGRIGLPEAMSTLAELVNVISRPEEDSNVKSLAIWAIGRIGPDGLSKSWKVLLKELTNPFWKVRTTTCMAISAMGPSIAPLALPILQKILYDGSVNR